MPYPSYRSHTSTSANALAVTAAAPAGVVSGDYQIVVISYASSSNTFPASTTSVAGWTRVADLPVTSPASPDRGGTHRVGIYESTTATGAFSVTMSGSARVWSTVRMAWQMPASSGGRTAALVTGVSANPETVTVHATPAIDTSTQDSLVINVGVSDMPAGTTGMTWSSFSAGTQRYNAPLGAEPQLIGITDRQVAPNTTGVTANWTISSLDEVALIAIRLDGTASAGTNANAETATLSVAGQDAAEMIGASAAVAMPTVAGQDAGPSPAMVLDIGSGASDNHFKLQIGESGLPSQTEVAQADLIAGYHLRPYFYTNPTGSAVVFYSPLDGALSSGAAAGARTELRETLADGTEIAFDALTGMHVMHGRTSAPHLPPVNPASVFAQLHNGANDRISIRTQFTSGLTKLLCRVNGTSTGLTRFSEDYDGSEFEWKMEVFSAGAVRIYYNDMVTPIIDLPTGTLVSTGDSWYFKAGVYNQSTTDAPTEYSETTLRDLWVTHTTADTDATASEATLAVVAQDATVSTIDSAPSQTADVGAQAHTSSVTLLTAPTAAAPALVASDASVTSTATANATTSTVSITANDATVTTDTGTPGTLTSSWLGIDAINLRVTGGSGLVRVDFSLLSDMSSPISSASVGPTGNGDARVAIPALTPDTTYYYRAFRGGSYIGTAQQFRSLPDTGGFVFGFASCRDTDLDADVLSTLPARGADFFLNLGDIHYQDINSTTAANYRAAYDDLDNHADLYNTLKGIPNAYVWSDHDFCGDASHAGSTGKATVRQVYRERVPHLALPSATGGIYQTFKQGRVRFILLDTRSYRDTIGTTSDGTMLGTEQLDWLQGLLDDPDTPLTFVVSPEGWHSSGSDDDWGYYQNERSTIAGWITASTTEVVFLCGDMHSLAYATAAQGTPGGVHVWHAAALNQFDNGVKGGPYAVTPYYHSTGQYGLVTVVDTGLSITATFNGVRQGTSDWGSSDNVTVDTSTDAPAANAAVAVTANQSTVSISKSATAETATPSLVAHDAAVTVNAQATTASVGLAGNDATTTTSGSANAQTALITVTSEDGLAQTSGNTFAAAVTADVVLTAPVVLADVEPVPTEAQLGVSALDATVSTQTVVQAPATSASVAVAANDAVARIQSFAVTADVAVAGAQAQAVTGSQTFATAQSADLGISTATSSLTIAPTPEAGSTEFVVFATSVSTSAQFQAQTATVEFTAEASAALFGRFAQAITAEVDLAAPTGSGSVGSSAMLVAFSVLTLIGTAEVPALIAYIQSFPVPAATMQSSGQVPAIMSSSRSGVGMSN